MGVNWSHASGGGARHPHTSHHGRIHFPMNSSTVESADAALSGRGNRRVMWQDLQARLVSKQLEAARKQFKASLGMPWPGSSVGGRPLKCDSKHHPVKPSAGRIDFIREWMVVNQRHTGRKLPVALSLEVGPCGHPMRLTSDVVRKQHDVDWSNSKANCNNYNPSFFDDGQFLRTVRDDTYDLVMTSHCLEHMPNTLLAISHWLRVVKPGGLVINFVPDPCDLDAMDSVRVAMPPQHFLDELRSGRPDTHEAEQAVSLARFYAVTHDARSGAKRKEPVWQTARQISKAGFDSLLAHGHRPNRTGLGHVHAWDTAALEGMLHLAESALPFRTLEAGSHQDGMLREMRMVLQKRRPGEPAGPMRRHVGPWV